MREPPARWDSSQASPLLRTAIAAARAAGRLQMQHFRQPFAVEFKDDGSHVTQIDRDSEALIRSQLARADGSIGFLGEETSIPAEASAPLVTGSRWIVDPIDGTSNFVRGLPNFGPIIALEARGELVIGVMHVPALNETIWAERGAGAYMNGQRVNVSGHADLATASIAWDNDPEFHKAGWAASLDQVRATHYNPGFLDLYGYLCLAVGRLDAILMMGEHPWDTAAATVILEEAGGRLTDFRGEASVYHGQTLASNGLLHDALLDVLKDCR